ncbi:hypothetical protein LEP1GSC151_5745 [Leptospira interrogans serovar Grippotyphosa str. LT2186]|uniref:Uncharacterized protein n=3 Tax=Leptospira interrogans TaxID=173 RepID=M3HZY6_LEPIR|nr:hypothetical protein G436_4688 [Leptospira interrogans serovar Hardjo str. Norma]EKO24855.1 hypothetical protein LEP1GSC104_0332 [Leptospira interrogans str. UI 12621]EKO86891.1 hypothetical protein LEP1GSC009_0313 [Leptospira interrogans serovar Grippotyphosa str. Andaman]EKO98452.1 hypothetical protein LEP1GSC057_2343 [Leptospira interrogans str. Brem 329]EKP83313.1 hypothetical protein LEP1GSC020_0225 [Leptospira interrogans serovar Grippotyphosa str. 2006006986]EKR44406.1 hypothetical p
MGTTTMVNFYSKTYKTSSFFERETEFVKIKVGLPVFLSL